MFSRVFTVKSSAWWLLVVATVVALGPRFAWQLGLIDSQGALYVVQPVLVVLAAGIAHLLLGGQRDRLRHKSDKMLIIASVMSVWFVAYFLSGLALTFVHNVVASSWQIIAINLLAFGAAAASVEYVRYALMLLAGRRNALWFGVIVSLILAVQQIGLLQMNDLGTVIDIVKFVITFVVPAVVGSFLLTYLSVSTGLGSQLVYSLGIVAVTVLPPIIPKYDWYMTSMSSVLLAVAIYIMIDRASDESDEVRARHRHRHPKVAFDAAFGLVMVALVMFMVGVFTYKPVVIMSNSMVPIFSKGSIVIVQQLRDPMDISIGDIIQYQTEDKVITHRVVAIDTAEDDSGDRIFTTKGDNNPSNDTPVNQSHLIGIVRSTVPYVGYPTVWLREVSQKH
jgi:signal peptidase